MPASSHMVIQDRKGWRYRLRFLRAIWRDSLALWREFRRPITIFLFVIFVGGFVYGELHNIAGRGYIAPIDRPYVMIQLMVLESADDTPPSEWYLIGFWYALPPILIFIIGTGATDFVRLFFNRNERLDAWRAAVASTYHHHVIVMGAGHVGLRVIRELVKMGVDVVVIDDDPDPGVEDEMKKFGTPLLIADGRLESTLDKAGLHHADAFITCTGNDWVNLNAIMRARHMQPTIRIVTRVWDNQFAGQIEHQLQVQSVLSSSELAAPSFAAAAMGIEITQSIKVGDDEYSMLHIRVNPDSFMEGVDIGTLQTEYNMDIVLHSRSGYVKVQPPRDKVVEAHDALVIFARHDRLLEIVALNRSASKKK